LVDVRLNAATKNNVFRLAGSSSLHLSLPTRSM